MSQPHSRGSSAHTLSSSLAPPPDDQPSIRLRDAVQRLKQIIPVLTVSILALRRQNSELGEDIATVVDLHASAPLDVLVDELGFFLESIAAQRAEHRRAAA